LLFYESDNCSIKEKTFCRNQKRIKTYPANIDCHSESVLPLDEFKVLLEESKFVYLINEKLGKLKQAGLDALDVSNIESIIKSKINGSYIYNLKYLAQHNVMIFNIMLEIPNLNGYPTRLTAALEYIPDKKTLRVITLH
jgi:hypothetical protein